MAKVNASNIRKVAERNKLRPKTLTPQEVKANTIKKYTKMVGILVLGTLVGATIGISNERDHNMDTYSQQSYDAGITDAKKTWYASIVKANEKDTVDITEISIPIDGIVSRSEDGDLFCKSRITEGVNFTMGELEQFKCNYVTTRATEFSIGELEKVIPHNGKIERLSDNEYSCNTSSLSYYKVGLDECVSFLRTELNSEYNEFIDTNYLPEHAVHLKVGITAELLEAVENKTGNTFGMDSSSVGGVSGSSGGVGFGLDSSGVPPIEGGTFSGGAGGGIVGPGGEPAEQSSSGGWIGIGSDIKD